VHKYLQRAIKNAHDHDFTDLTMDFKLCAIIAKGGVVLSVGFNKAQTNGFVEHYTDQIKGDRDYNMTTHAEMDAVLSARSKTDLRGSKIYVARIRPPGNLDGKSIGMAKPCEICQNVLWAYGIKRAYYTIDDNNYGIMKVLHRDVPQEGDDQTIYVGG